MTDEISAATGSDETQHAEDDPAGATEGEEEGQDEQLDAQFDLRTGHGGEGLGRGGRRAK